jgi:hypothetical protein
MGWRVCALNQTPTCGKPRLADYKCCLHRTTQACCLKEQQFAFTMATSYMHLPDGHWWCVVLAVLWCVVGYAPQLAVLLQVDECWCWCWCWGPLMLSGCEMCPSHWAWWLATSAGRTVNVNDSILLLTP